MKIWKFTPVDHKRKNEWFQFYANMTDFKNPTFNNFAKAQTGEKQIKVKSITVPHTNLHFMMKVITLML